MFCTENNVEILIFKIIKNWFFGRKLRNIASPLHLFDINQIKTNSVVVDNYSIYLGYTNKLF